MTARRLLYAAGACLAWSLLVLAATGRSWSGPWSYTVYAAWIGALLLGSAAATLALAQRSKDIQTRVVVVAVGVGFPVAVLLWLVYTLYRIADMEGHS